MSKRHSVSTGSAPYSVSGGLALEPQKRALNGPIINVAVPAQLIIPLLNYQRIELRPVIAVGDKVKRGQAIAPGLLAPSSGEIIAIEARPIIHPAALSTLCVVIQCDGTDSAAVEAKNTSTEPAHQLEEFLNNPAPLIEQAALAGLGGAGFPTDHKILRQDKPIPHTLIIK